MMMNGLAQLGPERATQLFGDWTDRVAHGELPSEAPPRPQGVERNVVVTVWDFVRQFLKASSAAIKRFEE
jgi:hypothetical protein